MTFSLSAERGGSEQQPATRSSGKHNSKRRAPAHSLVCYLQKLYRELFLLYFCLLVCARL